MRWSLRYQILKFLKRFERFFLYLTSGDIGLLLVKGRVIASEEREETNDQDNEDERRVIHRGYPPALKA